MDVLSDRGSTPLVSTKKDLDFLNISRSFILKIFIFLELSELFLSFIKFIKSQTTHYLTHFLDAMIYHTPTPIKK